MAVESVAQDYAGDVSPRDAWQLLSEDPTAVLIDVRSSAEWAFVGVPDLRSLGKATVLASWQTFPGMALNQDFTRQLALQLTGTDSPLLFICRSGQRSRDAAVAMTQAGYKTCLNVSEGFEGGIDPSQHRSSLGGWKKAELPWVQN